VNFSLSIAQQNRHRSFRTFGESLNDQLTDYRSAGNSFDWQTWRTCSDAGILNIVTPLAYRNPQAEQSLLNPEEPLSILDCVSAMEGFGEGCSSNGLAFALNTHLWTVQHLLITHGSANQKQTWLPALSSGEIIGCHAMTDINGIKCFISLAPVAEVVLLFASTQPSEGKWGISCFVVNLKTPGIHVSETVEKMGLNEVPMGTITFENCRVPTSSLLGPEGAGQSIANGSLEIERCCILASQVGRMQTQLDACVKYARTRIQSNIPIGQNQSISNRIADMKVRLATARLMLYQVAAMKDDGKSTTLESAMLKLLVSENFLKSSLDSMRIHGGRGYIADGGVEHDVRDSMGGVLYAGTSDIQRNVIAGMLGL